jgi:hypothetical protein
MVVNMDRRARDFVGCACDLFPEQSTHQWRKLIMTKENDNRLNERVICGDCLRPDCAGCEA